MFRKATAKISFEFNSKEIFFKIGVLEIEIQRFFTERSLEVFNLKWDQVKSSILKASSI